MTIQYNNPDARMVFVTCPDAAVARDIAQALVVHHEAACVNVIPGLESVYQWQGKVETDAETLLVIKTQYTRLADVEARVHALHPDELPELVAVPVTDGSQSYLEWLRQETDPQ